jgi:hypothetical protein
MQLRFRSKHRPNPLHVHSGERQPARFCRRNRLRNVVVTDILNNIITMKDIFNVTNGDSELPLPLKPSENKWSLKLGIESIPKIPKPGVCLPVSEVMRHWVKRDAVGVRWSRCFNEHIGILQIQSAPC